MIWVMSWASHRKLLYAIGGIVVLLLIIAVPIYKTLTIPPSCTDGKQNGDEHGTDCGGSCALVCTEDARAPIVRWARMFSVGDGFYDAIAYIENPNIDARAAEAIYRFKVYDADNVLILERLNKTRLEAGEVFPIFMGGIKVGERQPRRVFFEFEPVTFLKSARVDQPLVPVSPLLENPDVAPRLTAILKNRTAFLVSDIDVVAILYTGENAVTGSATRVDQIPANGQETVVFTWSRPITDTITRIEIVPRPRETAVRRQ